jgi:hypothetical protein
MAFPFEFACAVDALSVVAELFEAVVILDGILTDLRSTFSLAGLLQQKCRCPYHRCAGCDLFTVPLELRAKPIWIDDYYYYDDSNPS